MSRVSTRIAVTQVIVCGGALLATAAAYLSNLVYFNEFRGLFWALVSSMVTLTLLLSTTRKLNERRWLIPYLIVVGLWLANLIAAFLQ